MPIIARDGAYDQVGGLSVGVPEITFPFIRNGDSVARIIRRRAKQTPAAWLADRAAARFTPGEFFDTEYADAVLVEQTEPSTTETGLYAIGRTFATVPGDQITYGSRVITKPDASSYGTLLAASIVDYTEGAAVSAGAAYSYGGSYFAGLGVFRINTCSGTRTLPTGGTFTLTYKTSTTAALAYNESASNIAAALNALASVVSDGLTFSASGQISTGQVDLTITVGSTATSVTSNGASLTAAAAGSIFTYRPSTTSQTLRVGSRATIGSHGFSGTENLLVGAAAVSLFPPSLWSVVDANTIATYYDGSFISASEKTRSYTPGTDRVRIRKTQRFYLPGYTTGITTPADIPLPTLLINDEAFLDAIASNTMGFTDYDASELTRWNDWPIYTQTFEALDLASV